MSPRVLRTRLQQRAGNMVGHELAASSVKSFGKLTLSTGEKKEESEERPARRGFHTPGFGVR